jgi:serine/threonine-protein kinase RsbW
VGKAAEIDMAGDNTSSHARQRGGWSTDSDGHRDQIGKAAAGRESDIRLTLPARPENVAVVRHVLGALAEALDLPRSLIEDMRLAVTEACTNVVRHAYNGGEGTIDVVVRPKGGELEVIVEDTGRGLGPSPDTSGPGLGLPLIAALADRLEIDRSPSSGSRLVMSFLRARETPAMGLA